MQQTALKMNAYSIHKQHDWRDQPASNTKTLSQSMTVGILCAMLIIVHDENSCRVIFWILASVWESTEAVASSINKIWVCFSMTRPRQRSCLWPTLQFSPLSATMNNQSKKKWIECQQIYNNTKKHKNSNTWSIKFFRFGNYYIFQLTALKSLKCCQPMSMVS